MDRLWQLAPMPALCVRSASACAGGDGVIGGGLHNAGHGVTVQANTAALAWALAAGVSHEQLHTLALQAHASGALAGDVQLGAAWLQCVPVALPDGLLLWLAPRAVDQGNDQRAMQTQMVTDALGGGFWSRDIDAQGWVWDAQMYRIYGYPPHAGPPSRERWFRECVHPEHQAWLSRRTDAADLNQQPLLETRFRAADRDGAPRWIQALVCRAVRDGRPMVLGMHMDVTERQQAEDLRAEKHRLQAQSAEKARFMAGMSHELRTPMNAVLGFTRLLETDTEAPPSPRQRERLAHIASAGVQLMGLIDDLLSVAHRDTTPTPAAPASGLHVLCVEDNPVNLQLVRELIALRPQVRLRTAEDGLSGVAAAMQEKPDLLLLDLQLPDIDGLEVMRRLRAQAPMQGLRIVALSADAMPDHIEAALAAGFDDYWTKPIQFDAFLGHIDKLAAEVMGT